LANRSQLRKNNTVFESGRIPGTLVKFLREIRDGHVAVYKTSDFRKGLKVQIDGDPYLMIEMNFVKPGKGNALYKCKLRNLIRNTVLDRTYKGGDTLESADVNEVQAQYLYRQGDTFVFMNNETFDQYELTAEQVDDNWKYLKEGMVCSMVLYNDNPITMAPPNHVELKVEYCEPGAKGDTATNVTKVAKMETGGEFIVPAFINMGNVLKIDTRTGSYVERVST
jgi:elongation factor P